MQIAIQTQIHENYGAHDWDGEGDCPQYWKPKGGNTILITDVPLNIDHQAVVDYAGSIGIECDNKMFREHIVGWSLESDDFTSQFEKDQLEYEGEITYHDARIEYSELLETQYS